MLRLLKLFLLTLVLLLVFFSAALLAMRYAIHGREVRVPRLQGLTTAEAERRTSSDGLVISVESRFYSSEVPEGHIVSQAPAPGTRVRRGWKIRVAESLGSQRSAVPNLVGQSERVAELNISRHGLDTGAIAVIHYPGVPASTVIAQNPLPDSKHAASPKVNLLITAPDNSEQFVMPNFVGQSLASVSITVQQAGFTVGKVDAIPGTTGPSGMILRQFPPPGQKIAAGGAITFEVRK